MFLSTFAIYLTQHNIAICKQSTEDIGERGRQSQCQNTIPTKWTEKEISAGQCSALMDSIAMATRALRLTVCCRCVVVCWLLGGLFILLRYRFPVDRFHFVACSLQLRKQSLLSTKIDSIKSNKRFTFF